MSRCNKCIVSGHVQGVFYRGSTQQKAQKLRLTGHAKNLSNGNVEPKLISWIYCERLTH